ncbi:unnamed protein product [Lota lota]
MARGGGGGGTRQVQQQQKRAQDADERNRWRGGAPVPPQKNTTTGCFYRLIAALDRPCLGKPFPDPSYRITDTTKSGRRLRTLPISPRDVGTP